MTYTEWLAEVRRLFGDDARFATLSETIVRIAYEEGDTPEAAARWCRIAAGAPREGGEV